MFDTNASIYFYRELSDILSEATEPRQKLIKFYGLYKEIINKITEKEKRIFSTYFSKTVFVIDSYKVPDDLSSLIGKFRYIASKTAKDKDYYVKEKYIIFSLAALGRLIEFFFDEDIPTELLSKIKDFEDIEERKSLRLISSEKIDFLRCVLIGKLKSENGKTEIICRSDEYGLIKVRLFKPWKDIFRIAWKGAVLNLIDVYVDNNDSRIIRTGYNTLISLEPDYLMDATDLAECFLIEGANPKLYFLKKFTNSGLNENLVVGNIVNTCFDELLNNNDVDFDEVFNRAVLIKPLQIFVLALRDRNLVKAIRDRTQKQFDNLKKIIQDISVEILSIEPSFISPKYGLQGRLDVLLEYFDDTAKKDIIELKSGKSPSTPITIKSSDGKKITTYVWNNHLAQTTCYNLLLDSTFEGRSGVSSILYSSSIIDPLRDAENILQKKQEVLNLRNWIIAYENALREGNYNLFIGFTADKFGAFPPFSKKDLVEFQESYTTADEISREYFNRYVTFILNEISSSKLGSNKGLNKGFSSLWLESIPEKEESFKILTNLKLDKTQSDFSNYHLVFYCDEANLKLTSLRKGDMIVLYPIEDDGSVSVLNNQVLKCAIKELSEEFIKVSLRNKLYDKRMFTEDRLWVIEQDYLDSTNKKLLNSVFEFLKADERKRELIFGLIKPEFEIQNNISNKELNANQKEIVEKALSAKDYFLIQGPPGTGKTSYVLRNIVDNIYNTTDENILVLAYTNRAVDEICTALKNINADFEFLRTGSKESSEHSDVLISALSDNLSTRELFIKVRDARVFVSTVSSIISNPEILELKEFHTAVVDEASQILEPQIIGILTKVSRFILIGDEKQLPAVVTQDDIKSTAISEILERIHLKDLRTSLFERLLTCCNENGWKNSFGMLKKQARMHVEIQEFPNKYFYHNSLEPFQPGNWQSKSCKRFLLNSPDTIIRELAKSRVIFIPTKSEKAFKVNFSEAKLTVNLAKKISEVYRDDFNENTVGIISPFRAQCAEIYRQMEPGLRKKVMVDTVERFQGSERDIIIISFAVNHEYQLASIQSLTSYVNIPVDRKLNVAITRAKEHLIFLGNPEILKKSQVYLKLIDFIKEKGGFSDLPAG